MLVKSGKALQLVEHALPTLCCMLCCAPSQTLSTLLQLQQQWQQPRQQGTYLRMVVNL